MVQVTGIPDYARLSVQAGQILYNVTSPLSTYPLSPIVDAVGFGYLNVSVSGAALTDIYTLNITWLASNAVAPIVKVYSYVCFGAQLQAFQVPCIGRYFKISANLVSGAGTTNIQIIGLGSNVYAPTIMQAGQPAPLISINQNIASTVTVTGTSNLTVGGSASLFVYASVNNEWHIGLNYYDASLVAWTQYAYIQGGDYPLGGVIDIRLPLAPFQLSLTNDSVGAQVLAAYVVSAYGER